MLEIIIMRGLPGSGKSTWAKNHQGGNKHFVIINKDGLRNMFYNEFDPVNDEGFVHKAMLVLIEAALSRNKSIIVDNMHLKDSQVYEIEKLVNRVAGDISQITVMDFRTIPLDVCLARNAARDRKVPEDVIVKFWNDAVKGKF